MPKILIVGGGYAGFYTAWKLEKSLRKGEAEVTLIDPLPYMTYQPFLPEVAAGAIDPRYATVVHRRHLKTTKLISGRATFINNAEKKVTVTPLVGEPFDVEYDQVVVTAGAVSRTFPIPGVADLAYGMKNIEEAVAVRDRLITNFDKAAGLPKGDPLRERLLTVTVVGGGFAGIEAYGELRSAASALLQTYPEIDFDETKFHLVEAMGRIMPEVSLETSHWVVNRLAERGAPIHLDTQLKSAEGGKIELSNGDTYESDLIVWTAGVMATPTVTRNTDLPIEARGRVTTNASLRVIDADGEVIEGAWSAGDVAAVPDLTGKGVGGFCVPNAQHAVRQAKRLAKNLIAVLRGEDPVDYIHKSLGAVASIGLYDGVFQSGNLAFKGFIAWLMHRGYHGLAMPSWERKWRVIFGWLGNFFLGRDFATISAVQTPRANFEEFASRPRPAAPEVAAAPAVAPAPAVPAAAAAAPTPEVVEAAPAPKRAPRKTAAQRAAEADAKAPEGAETPAE
ncbi:NAD(P)/FAD-dependent oxidoreductase [Gryllotalpicola protaetiae]|uniref:NAD(P)/FAD-dependent oxidoreductase n=1 Tax=Gryllotalpicola protaetiae TaxID=2419771 RepID=A0A387BKD6_9MICO|nr:NAD(P)/FAD-dependent oxidoreductase [Gryllotalpicola protaetiae]AYG02624.1 NAD(P)/FAD-dependent oxidoreductase [Gryllotalpicola protaetiae]